ncbi:MAG: hypothetical protein K2P99_03515 [Burkholderiales bacterium]|nr:hypothetical protein [Burkholderiales bacterium]
MEINQLYDWQLANYNKLTSFKYCLPSAILLYGVNGCGVYNLATNFIASILCANPNKNIACGKCNSCVLLRGDSHPDLFNLNVIGDDIESKSKSITVNMVRRAIDFAYLSTHLADKRIIFIENANLLNLNSANALLKILEEPPSYVLFVLITDSIGRILPTMRSRCQKINISLPHNLQNDENNFWASFSNASLCEALLTEDDLALLTDTLCTPSIDNIFSCTEVFNGKKVSFGVTLEFIYKWLADICIYINSEKLSIFYNYEPKIKALIPQLNYQELFYLQDEINYFIQWVNHPLNQKLQIENILFKYQQLFTK